MGDLSNYMVGDYRDLMSYSDMVKKYGLTKMSPLIITVSITGGQHGAEANPNLPEEPHAQAQSTLDAYNAGASLVHIHRRSPENPAIDTKKAEEYLEVNRLVRAKCPDIIINNTCIGGHTVDTQNMTMSDLLHVSCAARPEVASIDITTTTQRMNLGARSAEIGGERPAFVKKFDLMNTDEDIVELLKYFDKYDIKPEWEMYNLTDIKRLKGIIDKGIIKGPHWCMMLFGGNGVFPNYQAMALATQMLPENAIFSTINIGGAHNAMLAQSIIMGNHIRVGLEDVTYYGPHQLAESNAQLVERAVRIAKELGRPIATPAQAREMLGLGAPRQYDFEIEE